MNGKKILYAALLPHAQETNIVNIAHVRKIDFYTWKRALKHKQKPKHNTLQTLSCAVLEKPTSRKEKTLLSRQRHDLHAKPHPLFL
jgi:hypothetical protein